MSVVEPRERVRLGRLKLRKGQVRFAQDLGISPWAYGSFERGTRKLSYEEMRLVGTYLAEQLGLTIRDFFPGYIPRDGADMPRGRGHFDAARYRANDDEP